MEVRTIVLLDLNLGSQEGVEVMAQLDQLVQRALKA